MKSDYAYFRMTVMSILILTAEIAFSDTVLWVSSEPYTGYTSSIKLFSALTKCLWWRFLGLRFLVYCFGCHRFSCFLSYILKKQNSLHSTLEIANSILDVYISNNIIVDKIHPDFCLGRGESCTFPPEVFGETRIIS